MPHKKSFRGGGRRPQAKGVTDDKLSLEKNLLKKKQRIVTNADRYLFVSGLINEKPQIRFDYSFNIFSMRGNWESKVKVIALYLPFVVNRSKCKKFEELVNKAFESIFLV